MRQTGRKVTDEEASGVGLTERLIEVTDWGRFDQTQGSSAHGIGRALRSLLRCDRSSVDAARDDLEDMIVLTEASTQQRSRDQCPGSILDRALSSLGSNRGARLDVLDPSGAPVEEGTEPGDGSLSDVLPVSESRSGRLSRLHWTMPHASMARSMC